MRWKNYSYKHVDGVVAIVQYLGEETASDSVTGEAQGSPAGTDETVVRVPATIDGEPVVKIGKEAFSEYGSFLERIELPPTVKRIGEGAFKMCMSLEELVLSEGLESIGAEAFYLTPLEELYLPSAVREIENPWELSGIRFRVSPENPMFSTDGYGLYRTYEGRADRESFVCENEKILKNFVPDSGNYEERVGMRNTQNQMPEKELLVVCSLGARTKYTVAAGTTRIAENAFAANTDLKKVILPEGVRVIGETAFEGCQNLEELVLPEGLAEIGANAFSHCIRLRALHLPATLAKLGTYALSDTFGWSDTLNGLEKITVAPGNNVFYADDTALFQKSYGSVKIIKYFGHERHYKIPDGVTQIGESAFRRADFHVISAPKTLKNVGEDAFRECKNLEEICLEETGAIIYVPQKPIYRKDEVTALFYCAEREERLRDREEETYDLPEKWQRFARTPIYSGKGAEDTDAYEQYVFDYRGYDALFHTYLNLPDQYGMALCRLEYPVLLSADVRGKYEDFLREHFAEILESLADTEDMEHLAALAELGFFTAENIEDSLDVFNRKRRTKQMSYLLDYKREHLTGVKFDFSL